MTDDGRQVHRALDVRFRVVIDADDELRSPLLLAMEPLSESVPPTVSEPILELTVTADTTGWLISWDGSETRVVSIGAALARSLEIVNQRAADALEEHIPVHAAAVRRTSEDGVIALAGSSGAGKSTLGAAAIRAGWGFVAEEIAAVHPESLQVRSFHRSIGLRHGGADALGITYATDDPVYSDVYPWPSPRFSRVGGGPLAGIALVDRGDHPPEVTELRPAQALVDLIEHCVVPDDDRVPHVFGSLDRLVRRVPVVRLSYRTPADGVALLDELTERWQ